MIQKWYGAAGSRTRTTIFGEQFPSEGRPHTAPNSTRSLINSQQKRLVE